MSTPYGRLTIIGFYQGNGAPATGLPAGLVFYVGDQYQDLTNKVLYFCDTGGTNTTSHWTSTAGGSTSGPTTQVLTSASGTYTTPAGVKAILVECQGPGGDGGANNGIYGGSGGGGGGYLRKMIRTPAASYPYTVGAHGTGTATTFGTSFLTAGAGGNGAPGGPPSPGGTATGGDVNITGGTSQSGATVAQGFGGDGAGSVLGPSGLIFGGTAQGVGGSAGGYGGGGGGGSNTNNAGGTGTSGIIIVTEFYA